MDGSITHNLELISPPNPQLVELLRKSILLQHMDISMKLYKQCCQELYHLITSDDRTELLKLIVKSISALNPEISHLDYTFKRPMPSKPNYAGEYLDWFVDDTIERTKRSCEVFSQQDWDLIFKGWAKDSKSTHLETAFSCILQTNYSQYSQRFKQLEISGNHKKMRQLMIHWKWKCVQLTNSIINSVLISRTKSKSMTMSPIFNLYFCCKEHNFNPDPSIIVLALHRFYQSPSMFSKKVSEFAMRAHSKANPKLLITVANCLQERGMFKESHDVLNHMLNDRKLAPTSFVMNLQVKNIFELDDISNLAHLLSHYKQNYDIKPNKFTLSHIIEGFANLGDLEDMEHWYKELTTEYGIKPTVVTYLHLIKAYSALGEVSKVDKIAQEYLSRHDLPIKPDPIRHLITFYGNLGSFNKVIELYEILIRSQPKIQLPVWICLIRASVNCRQLAIGAQWLTESSKPKHLAQYNPVLVGMLEGAGWIVVFPDNSADIQEFSKLITLGEKD